MSLRKLSCLSLSFLLAQCSSFHSPSTKLPPGPSPLAWNGKYLFNPSDTDFESGFEIQFHPAPGGNFTPWRADGTIVCGQWKQTIVFKNALVEMSEDGPRVLGSYFSITPVQDKETGGKSLYLDGYEHKKAPSP